MKDEYLLDRSLLKIKGFRFLWFMKSIVDKSFFEDFLLPNLLNLLRRSENNSETLKEVILCDLELDYSNYTEEIILKSIKNAFFGKQGENCVLLSINVIKGIKKFDFLMVFFKKIEEFVNSTINESNKLTLLQLFEGFIQKIDHLTD